MEMSSPFTVPLKYEQTDIIDKEEINKAMVYLLEHFRMYEEAESVQNCNDLLMVVHKKDSQLAIDHYRAALLTKIRES